MENKAISSDLIRGHIDTIILYSLTDSDKHAQQISDYVAEKSNDEYQINQATLYSSLKRLESLKYVSAYWHSAETGRRRYFKISDAGREIIRQNTESWSYSRSIIDKLMNCEPVYKTPEPEIITKFIEKPVVIYKNVNENFNNSTENVQNLDLLQKSETVEKVEITEKPTNEEVKTPIFGQEMNFRSILSDLIKSTEKQKIPQKQPVLTQNTEEIIKEENIKPTENLPKFNETIREDFKDIKTASNNIDFSDIIEKGKREGYNVNVSSTDKLVKFGSVFINKVRFFASATFFLLTLIEILLLTTLTKSFITFNALSIILPIVFFAIYPTICAVSYFKLPSKTSTKLKKDGILTYGIVIFNLILFTFVLNLLFETDFYQTANVILYIIIPFAICLNVFIYSVLKYFFSTKKPFMDKKQ